MGGPSYSHAQLLALRKSPLARKPDGLPSIAQWMDVPTDQNIATNSSNNSNSNSTNGAVRRTRGLRDGEGGAGSEQRPLINPMGQFGRRQSMQPGEETVLGPPKLSFLSASRTSAKAANEAKERTGIVSIDGDHLGDRFPREKSERWSRDRDNDRSREKGYANGRRAGREDGEGWTSVKGRKSLSQEDFERFGRGSDRSRDKHEGDFESESAPRRGNRERTEQRWSRRDENKDDGTKSSVQGGWRERDRDRDRDRDREWAKGGNKVEEDPEWMDTKIEKKEFKPRTQEDFQRWKEQMRAKDAPPEERDDSKDASTETPSAISSTASPMLTAPLQTHSAAEPTQGILFGNWGRERATDIAPQEAAPSKPKTDKKSRFMTMFAKSEEPSAPAQTMPIPSSPGPAMEANADKEGFQRILQMLGQVNVGGPQAPQTNMPVPMNGTRHVGGGSIDFHQQSTPPEPQPSRPPPRTSEQQSMLDNVLTSRPPLPETRSSQQPRFGSMPSDNAIPEQFRMPRPESNYQEDTFSQPPPQPPPQQQQQQQQQQQPSSRINNQQDANLAAILNARSREESQRDQATKQRERDFLLTLMQQPSRATPPQQHSQNMPRQLQENQNMAFFDQARQQPQQQKGRGGIPPGFMEDPRMYNENDVMRRETERREQELRQQLNIQQQQQQQQQQHQEVMRQKTQRMPIGFPGHDDPTIGIQRRSTGGDPRLTTNMGIPSQSVSDMAYMGGRGQPGMPPTPQERSNIAPPPGFGGPMRQPPGLGAPPSQQQMGPGGPPSFSAGNTPLGHPPGFPPNNMRAMGFPGGPGSNGMQGMPQGYFPPPGYGPPMPGMRGDDPRMMFDGQFGGPGPRPQQQGRPGPPNMY